jgi:hypothetical protein
MAFTKFEFKLGEATLREQLCFVSGIELYGQNMQLKKLKQ